MLRLSTTPRRRSVSVAGLQVGLLGLTRTISTSYGLQAAAQLATGLPPGPQSLLSRASSNESSVAGLSAQGPGAGLGSGLGLGLGPGPGLPVAEAPRVVLSLPHMLLAPVLEAALIAKRMVRMQRLRSDRGAVGVVRDWTHRACDLVVNSVALWRGLLHIERAFGLLGARAKEKS